MINKNLCSFLRK